LRNTKGSLTFFDVETHVNYMALFSLAGHFVAFFVNKCNETVPFGSVLIMDTVQSDVLKASQIAKLADCLPDVPIIIITEWAQWIRTSSYVTDRYKFIFVK
jgi:hypothetical protein